ncbi:MAG: CCA tRNA nucleotidyltransferase [Candidatus Acididesulfobacter guangdongensis]|uniref:CCA tRNA nucleotidyltransferase n=1 Tax=Acididesulfobacter guangdongensis TaxID=2597225 RepID=A0A519BF83_ACIG2|nr:MAG: CCA tRNA nucleotidyltransferase [Candidatus Acididesulfobacter guangdongensis]
MLNANLNFNINIADDIHLSSRTAMHLYATFGKIAEEHGFKIYIVGGFVRDLLIYKIHNRHKTCDLLEKPVDIDICVEGDAIIFAGILKQELYKFENNIYICNIKKHERFKTVSMVFSIVHENIINIDFASARREFYAKSGVLPSVKFSDLEHDLIRRDFSINALAFNLGPDNFFKIIDYYNGVKDILNKKIRVLHDLSFIDDPTRIFRAVRFEKRLGFRIEENTKKLLIDALSKGVMDNISGKRISNELNLIFHESRPEVYFLRLEKLGALKSIDEDLKFTSCNKRNFEKIRNFYQSNKEKISTIKINETKIKNANATKINIELLYLMELLIRLKDEKIVSILERLNFGENIKKLFLSIKAEIKSIKKIVRNINKIGINNISDININKIDINNKNNINININKIDINNKENINLSINTADTNNTGAKNIGNKYIGNANIMMNITAESSANFKSRLYSVLKPFNLYSIIFFIMRYNNNSGSDINRIDKYLKIYLFEIINVKSDVSGEDLKKLGFKEGPEIGKILNMLKLLKIDGAIKSRKEEIEYIKTEYNIKHD